VQILKKICGVAMACRASAPSELVLEVVLGYIGLRPMLLLVPLRGVWFINPNGIYFIWLKLCKLIFSIHYKNAEIDTPSLYA
jgi:hypothetical protein